MAINIVSYNITGHNIISSYDAGELIEMSELWERRILIHIFPYTSTLINVVLVGNLSVKNFISSRENRPRWPLLISENVYFENLDSLQQKTERVNTHRSAAQSPLK